MIRQYFSEKERDSQKYIFTFVKINQDKDIDPQFEEYIQKNILTSLERPSFYKNVLKQMSEEDMRNFILTRIIPNEEDFGKSVRSGDLGEVIASLIVRYFQNKEPVAKLRWKVNRNKSVFGTDIVAFDNINNPQDITFYEVKKKNNALERTKNEKTEEYEYLIIKAYNSLQYDVTPNNESILSYMSKDYEYKENYELAIKYADLSLHPERVNNSYEIFIITDAKIEEKDYKITLEELNKLQPTMKPLSITYIFINNISNFTKSIWNSIVDNGVKFINQGVI